ncbi:MAG TPA: hypothetical protein VHW00_08975 [Thermoanaerobaculia bacterium]|nr:hypothetical protein [Thermoanaerobaculia bacterium]
MRAALTLLLTLLLAPAALACSCAETTAKENFANAAAVLTGKVVKLEVIREENGVNTIEAKVRVIESRKGGLVTSELLTFVTSDGCCYCSFEYTIGATYLLYAYRADDHWSTSACTRSGIVGRGETNKDLEELGFSR